MAGEAYYPVGEVERVAPLVRRVLAGNPSAFTYTGTQTYLVGTGARGAEVAVIDPGPDLPAHVEAIARGTAGERLVAILCTHTHNDHSPAARTLAARTGAPIVGCAALALDDDGPRSDAAFDRGYAPDRVLADGETIAAADWTLTAVSTPGHTSNHLCFALDAVAAAGEGGALFSGDHVMGWSTSVISPPDGDMADYMASLDKLMGRQDAIYYPAHGPAIDRPQRLVRSMIGHRRQRESQILRLLEGDADVAIPAMVSRMYAGIDPRLHGAAGRSVLAHLIDLEARGRVRRDGETWAMAA